MTDAGCTNSGILSVLQQDESYLQLDIIGGLVKHQTTAANLQQPDIFRLPLEYSKGIWVVSLDKTQLLSSQNQMKVEWRVLRPAAGIQRAPVSQSRSTGINKEVTVSRTAGSARKTILQKPLLEHAECCSYAIVNVRNFFFLCACKYRKKIVTGTLQEILTPWDAITLLLLTQ